MPGKKGEFLLGIDVGTQSIRAALLSPEGEVVSLKNTPQDMKTPKPGYAIQDPRFWWESTVKNIRGIIEETGINTGSIMAIGVCAHMHGPVPIGYQGELLSNAIQLYCDKRSESIVKRFTEQEDTTRLLKVTGNPPTPNWFGFKIKWLKENQLDLYERTFKFLVPKDYVNYKLTGETVIDPSEASGSFLMDSKTNKWSDELIEIMDLDKGKLPAIFGAGEVIGRVSREAASITGLAEGTPVVAGGGDMLCTLLTSDLTEKGRVSDVTGTGSIICFYTGEPIYDERLMNLRHVIDGWVPFGIVDHSGGALRWFRDNFCQNEIDMAAKQNIDVYKILDEMAAAEEPGNNGLLFFPYLMGERTLGSSHSRGVFVGFIPSHNKGSAIRAIMEGIAFEHNRTLEILTNAGHEVKSVVHCGGGANSRLWSQIKADIYQKPVHTLKAAEGGIVGAAILAGTGVGIYPDAATGAKSCIRIKDEFQPNPEMADRYVYLFNIYKEVHDLLQEPFDKLAVMPE